MTDKRRLLVISHGYPPYYGGAEHVAGHLARAASKTGRWQVQVLTSDIGGRLPLRETQEDIELFRVPTRKKKWARHSVWELWSFLRSARSFQWTDRPDHILAHFSLPAGAVARRLGRQWNIPYSVVLHGSDVPGYQKARFGLLYHFVRPWVRRIWRDANHVVAVSEPLRALALNTWPEGKVGVILNGVDTDFFQPLEVPALKTSNDWITLISVAQLIPRKGLQHIIAGLAGWPSDWQGRVRLCLCGIGPYEGELRRLAEEKGVADCIEWCGLLKPDELRTRLQAADIFVLPSCQEGLPLALLEAMACGLPAVATAVGGIPQLLRDGENGCVVPAGDGKALTEALLRLANDQPLRRRLGAAARKTVQSWSWVDRWKDYERLIFENHS